MTAILIACLFIALLICLIFVYIQVREAHENNEILYEEIKKLKEQVYKLTRHNRVRAKAGV